MAKSGKPLTPYEQYKRQHKRILQILRRYKEKEGYGVTPEELRQGLKIPSPAEFKRITPDSFFDQDYYLGRISEFTAREVQSRVRELADTESEDDGWDNDDYPPEDSTLNQAIIDEFESLFMEPDTPHGNPAFVQHKLALQHELQAMWVDTLDTTDPYELAALLEENATTIKEAASRLQYASESLDEEQTDLTVIAEILNGGRPLTAVQADRISESAMWYNLIDNLRGGL